MAVAFQEILSIAVRFVSNFVTCSSKLRKLICMYVCKTMLYKIKNIVVTKFKQKLKVTVYEYFDINEV